MAGSTITSKGQATIPKAVRDRLKLRPGDRVDFVVEEDGRVVLVPVTRHLADLYGVLPRPAHPVSLDDMEAAIRVGAAKRIKRNK